MPDWALALIAMFISGSAGLGLGYLLGNRNGRVVGELKALHVSLAEEKSRTAPRPAPYRSARSILMGE